MGEYDSWENDDFGDSFGLDNYDEYGNTSRGKNKKRWSAIFVSLFLLGACILVLIIRSSRSTVEPMLNPNETEIVVVQTVISDRPPEGVEIGLMAPDFTLKTIEGDSITLSSIRGQPILLNFWATWCPFCVDEMPAFQNVYEEFKDDGFIVISITKEVGSEMDNVVDFRDNFNLTFPILLDEGGVVTKRYYVNSLPRTLMITPEGVINNILMGGPITENTLRQELSAMMP
jgi:cytochrome c biogenesis protein CcmG, thiol:disulfide interchange protein DsbE